MLPLFLISAACCTPSTGCLLPVPRAALSVLRVCLVSFNGLLEEADRCKFTSDGAGTFSPGCLWMVVINEGIDGHTLPFRACGYGSQAPARSRAQHEPAKLKSSRSAQNPKGLGCSHLGFSVLEGAS